MNQTFKKLLLILSISILSCKNDNSISKVENLPPEISADTDSEILNFKLPDRIMPDKDINANIEYDISLDSVTAKNIFKRYIFLHVVINNKKEPLLLESIKKEENRKAYIDSTGNGNFDFKINLKEKGESTFHAVIEDARFVTNKESEEGFKIITHSIILTKDLIIE